MKNIKISTAVFIASFAVLQACKKEPNNSGGSNNTTTTTTTTTPGNGTGPGGAIVAGTDPSVSATQGFFLDNWTAKTFTTPTAQTVAKADVTGAVTVSVDLSQVTSKVSRLLFGNNINPYNGQFIGLTPLMNNITALAPHIIRAPGGSLSDMYFFNGDGTLSQKPADAPDNLLDNAGTSSAAYYWFGNNTQDWTLSIDNYYKVLQQSNSTGLITVNYGYARYGTSDHPDQTAAHLAANWVRYDKGKTTYWEVGNENFGNWEAGYRIDQSKNKDGQPAVLTGTVYGTHFKVFADSMRKAAAEVGNTGIKIGVVLTSSNDVNNNAGVVNWNRDVLAAAGNAPDFYVVHNYYTPYNQNSTPGVILATSAPVTNSMMSWIKTSATNAGVTLKPVALDEWNIQAVSSMQDVSNIAGLHAVLTLGEIIKNQFSMASRWDLINDWGNALTAGDDQGMFSSGDEPGVAKWNARPAFYYMYFFQKYFGDRMVSSSVNGSTDIASYGSTFSSGQAGVILVNKASVPHVVAVTFKNYLTGSNYYYYTLNGGTDNAPFSRKVFVNGAGPLNGVAGGPDTYATIAASSAGIPGGLTVVVPAYGAVFLVADKQ